LRKHRSGHSEVDKETLIFGNPKGKRAIIFDDIGASFESILTTSDALIQYDCPLVVPCLTHAVFAGKYLENITKAAERGTIPRVAVTNSLPQSDFANFLPVPIDVIPVERMLAFFAREVATRSIAEVKSDLRYQDFILTPRPKDQVIAELLSQ
jgi:phosphoribosylpyrophosphate synthetase